MEHTTAAVAGAAAVAADDRRDCSFETEEAYAGYRQTYPSWYCCGDHLLRWVKIKAFLDQETFPFQACEGRPPDYGTGY